MMRRSRLEPGKPLQRTVMPQRKMQLRRTGFSGGARPVTSPGRAPSTLPKVSAKRSKENKIRTEVLRPMKAAQDWCSICGRTGLELNGHELLGAAQGGSRTDPDNIVLACNFCNGRCEDEPIAAAAHGWKINGHPLGKRRPWPLPSETAPKIREADWQRTDELTAVLLVDAFYSRCGHCDQQVLPHKLTHDEVSGYGPKRPGCGARFTSVQGTRTDITWTLLHQMRPDLPVRGEV